MTTSPGPEPDFPAAAAARGRVEPAPRRVRGFAGHELVFDTTAARYVWEVPYYPQYYIPVADVRPGYLLDEERPSGCSSDRRGCTHWSAAVDVSRPRHESSTPAPRARWRAWCDSSGRR